MENSQTNGGKNGAKPRWKRPQEKQNYTESEMARIKASREVLEMIGEMKKEGAFENARQEEKSEI